MLIPYRCVFNRKFLCEEIELAFKLWFGFAGLWIDIVEIVNKDVTLITTYAYDRSEVLCIFAQTQSCDETNPSRKLHVKSKEFLKLIPRASLLDVVDKDLLVNQRYAEV